MSEIVIAIPTIEARGNLWEDTAEVWRERTRESIEVVASWRSGSWSAGLNEIWEKHPDADVFVCASDDMRPTDDFWLIAALDHLERGECPVPTVIDPRMTTIGGTQDSFWKTEPTEGTEARMTNFPILKGEWLEKIFPLDPEMHYYADNEISDRLRRAGMPLRVCLDIVIEHLWDDRGRGAGMGSEEARMAHDRAIYRKLTRKGFRPEARPRLDA